MSFQLQDSTLSHNLEQIKIVILSVILFSIEGPSRAPFMGLITSLTVSEWIPLRIPSGPATQNHTQHTKSTIFLFYLTKQLRWESINNQPKLHITSWPERKEVKKCSLVKKQSLSHVWMSSESAGNEPSMNKVLFYSLFVSHGTHLTVILLPDYELF